MDFNLLQWLGWKTDLVEMTGLERDALHIYAAVAIQLGTALVTRRKLGDWLPWLAVAAVALIIEGLDIYADIWPDHKLQAGKAIHDLVNTMVMPTFLLLLSRTAPWLMERSKSS